MLPAMSTSRRAVDRLRPHLPIALIAIWLGVLWIAGGASRPDVMGQVVVRAAAWAILIVFVIFCPRPRLGGVKGVAAILLAATLLPVLHLLPLPPALWTALPGRELFTQAAIVIDEQQPWRPISISPGATVNALSSLIVPVATLLLVSVLSQREHQRTVSILLALVIGSSLLGLVQFSGGRFDHPLINDVTHSVSASFANRNHFALFAAIGCILAPGWAFNDVRNARWRALAALGLVALFALIILATGSRTGILVGTLGIAIGLLNVRKQITSELRRLPKKWAASLAAAALGFVIVALILSISLDRAISIDRAFAFEVDDDLRLRALPTIIYMSKHYFPVGSGIGAFDGVYRVHEPSELLGFAYLNHAHNDWLEVVLDAGLLGFLLLTAALGWWLWKSALVWNGESSSKDKLPRMGSGILLLVFVASVTDYPARTPMIMAAVVISAVWLSRSPRPTSASETKSTLRPRRSSSRRA